MATGKAALARIDNCAKKNLAHSIPISSTLMLGQHTPASHQPAVPATIDQQLIHQTSGANTMGREQKSNKETKKEPALSPKEKKAAKKAKKDSKPKFLD